MEAGEVEKWRPSWRLVRKVPVHMKRLFLLLTSVPPEFHPWQCNIIYSDHTAGNLVTPNGKHNIGWSDVKDGRWLKDKRDK